MAEKPFGDLCVERFDVPVWNVMPASAQPLLIIENRDDQKRIATFSAWNYETLKFVWRDVMLSEKWWLTLCAVENEAVVLKVFDSTDNPDKTSFQRIALNSGEVLKNSNSEIASVEQHVQYPAQYLDGEADFEVVKNFLLKKLKVNALLGAEYLEAGDFIFISYYKGTPASFVNSFCVFDGGGRCLFDEEIGTNLKGIGWNTFFIASGRVFFVKNKMELVTFRIV